MMETKPSFYTTEFWLTIATNLATILMALAGVLDPQYATVVMAIANALYALSRGLAKQGVSPSGVPASGVAQVITGTVETGVQVQAPPAAKPPIGGAQP